MYRVRGPGQGGGEVWGALGAEAKERRQGSWWQREVQGEP